MEGLFCPTFGSSLETFWRFNSFASPRFDYYKSQFERRLSATRFGINLWYSKIEYGFTIISWSTRSGSTDEEIALENFKCFRKGKKRNNLLIYRHIMKFL